MASYNRNFRVNLFHRGEKKEMTRSQIFLTVDNQFESLTIF